MIPRKTPRVYVLIDSRNREIFYVGMTTDAQRRVQAHAWDGHDYNRVHRYRNRNVSAPSNSAKAERIADIHHDGAQVIFKTVKLFGNKLDASVYERRLIAALAEEPWRAQSILRGEDPFAACQPRITNIRLNPLLRKVQQ